MRQQLKIRSLLILLSIVEPCRLGQRDETVITKNPASLCTILSMEQGPTGANEMVLIAIDRMEISSSHSAEHIIERSPDIKVNIVRVCPVHDGNSNI